MAAIQHRDRFHQKWRAIVKPEAKSASAASAPQMMFLSRVVPDFELIIRAAT